MTKGNKMAVGNRGNTPAVHRQRLLTTALQVELNRRVNLGKGKQSETRLETLAKALVDEAIGGTRKIPIEKSDGKVVVKEVYVAPKQWAMEMVWERMEGRVVQGLEIEDKTPVRPPSLNVTFVAVEPRVVSIPAEDVTDLTPEKG